MQFDIHNDMYVRMALNSGAIASSTTTNGNIIDTQGFNALEFILRASAYTDGTFTPSFTHGDDAALGDGTTVDAADLITTDGAGTSSAAVTAANAPKRIGYRGDKRYVRLNIVSTSVSSGGTLSAEALLARPSVAPTDNN
jgi:hypothetical protein